MFLKLSPIVFLLPALLAVCWCLPTTQFRVQFGFGANKQNIDSVCQSIALFFNTLNTALPIVATFTRGTTTIGIPYPAGKIVFNSTATSLKNCIAYTSGPLGTIAQLAVKDRIKIIFPTFSFDGDTFPANITADECTVKLHYHIELKDDGYSKMISMNVIFMEISNLGQVQLSRMTANGKETEDITEEADDVVRPILMKVLDDFSKRSLVFQFDPTEDDNDEGFEAFKMVFKRYLLNVFDDVNGISRDDW